MHGQKRLRYITEGALLQVGSEMTRECGLGSQVAWAHGGSCTTWCCSCVKGDEGIPGGIPRPRAVLILRLGMSLADDSCHDGDAPENLRALGWGVPRLFQLWLLSSEQVLERTNTARITGDRVIRSKPPVREITRAKIKGVARLPYFFKLIYILFLICPSTQNSKSG